MAPLRLGALTDPLRLGLLDRLELLLKLLRLGLLERLDPLKLLRLELLDPLKLLRLELLDRLDPLKLLRLELLLDERLLLTELLWLPPPLRPPPPRWASAGVALRANAIMTRVIAFEVFISLLLSFYCLSCFSGAKVRTFLKGNSETFT